MFNKGDRVIIKHNGGKPTYDKALGKQGTITQVRTYDKYDTIYYVELDCGLINENNDMNSWCCTEKMLQAHKELVVVRTRWTADDLQGYGVTEKNIIKENEMKILEIYYDRKRKQLDINQEKEIKKIKMKDEKYARFMELHKELEEFERENTISFRIDYAEFKFSKDIIEMGEKCKAKFYLKKQALEKLIDEVKSQLSMCETYEQKQHILKTYDIIDEQGKINA